MNEAPVILITGSRKGIGAHLARHYSEKGYRVIGCSRKESRFRHRNYQHFCVDVSDETGAKKLFADIRKRYQRMHALINNAGVGSLNHALLTPMATVRRLLETNVTGTFLFSREAAKLMRSHSHGRIVNFTSVAVPLRLEGEAAYASSKAAVIAMTHVLAKELASWNITVNAIGPSPVKTDLIRAVPEEKLERVLARQAFPRFAAFSDITNVIDFFLRPESNFITGQVIYLGGV